MRILFMGTPDFAVASLKRLVEDGHEICGVFTQPDKPKNRGHKLAFSPVKEFALSMDLSVYQPTKMRDGTALTLVRELDPQLIVVAAYGRILPEEILQYPKYGAINVHSSILPKYRGAAPINWAIMNGETVTGVTIMYMAKELDAGDIILCRETKIDPDEDAQMLTARLAELGADALHEAVERLSAGTATRTPQDRQMVTYAPMLSRELSEIDWNRSAQQIHDQVRGLIPWPCAKTTLLGKSVKVFRTAVGSPTSVEPGVVLDWGKTGIEIACADGMSIIIKEVQPDGGKRMSAAAYLAGNPIFKNRHE
jgi:methionyl-tRNA formyltransferase